MRSSLLPLAGLSLCALAAPAAAQPAPPPCQCAAPQPYAAPDSQPYAAPDSQPYAPPAHSSPGTAVPYYTVEAPREPWQAHRLGLGLRFGGTSIATSDPENPEEYSTLGLTARWRVSRRWELELAVDHGQLDNGDGTMGPAELSAGTVSALLHLRPHARWDWYLLAGVGGSERRPYAESPSAEERSHLALGVGLERRFEHLVLGVELRGLAQEATEQELDARPLPSGASHDHSANPQLSNGGAQATLHAAWYF